MKSPEKTVNQEELREKYKKQRLEEDEDFHRYLDGVFPKPRGLLLEKFKRKYFRKHYEKDFDINFDNINAKVSFQLKFERVISEYNRLKNSVITTHKEKAEDLLKNFKEENREMLSDRELIADFVETTVRSATDSKTEAEVPSPKMELMIAVANLLSIFFNLFFGVEWLTGIVLALILLCCFFMHLIKIDYDFSDDYFFSRMTNYMKNHNIWYGLLFLFIFSRSPLSYMERAWLIVIQDLLSAVVITIRGFELCRPEIIAGCENFAILVEIFYKFVLVLYLVFRFGTRDLIYGGLLFGFILVRIWVWVFLRGFGFDEKLDLLYIVLWLLILDQKEMDLYFWIIFHYFYFNLEIWSLIFIMNLNLRKIKNNLKLKLIFDFVKFENKWIIIRNKDKQENYLELSILSCWKKIKFTILFISHSKIWNPGFLKRKKSAKKKNQKKKLKKTKKLKKRKQMKTKKLKQNNYY